MCILRFGTHTRTRTRTHACVCVRECSRARAHACMDNLSAGQGGHVNDDISTEHIRRIVTSVRQDQPTFCVRVVHLWGSWFSSVQWFSFLSARTSLSSRIALLTCVVFSCVFRVFVCVCVCVTEREREREREKERESVYRQAHINCRKLTSLARSEVYIIVT